MEIAIIMSILTYVIRQTDVIKNVIKNAEFVVRIAEWYSTKEKLLGIKNKRNRTNKGDIRINTKMNRDENK